MIDSNIIHQYCPFGTKTLNMQIEKNFKREETFKNKFFCGHWSR